MAPLQGVYPSGQRGRAVNPLAQPTEVRILPPPLSGSLQTTLRCGGHAPTPPAATTSRPVRRRNDTGVKHFHHPVVGELSLSYNRLDLPADHGLTIFTYAAEPGSRSEEALELLGSWAATADLAESALATDQS